MQKFKNKSNEILIDIRTGKQIFPGDFIELDLEDFTDNKVYDLLKANLKEEVVFFAINTSIEKFINGGKL